MPIIGGSIRVISDSAISRSMTVPGERSSTRISNAPCVGARGTRSGSGGSVRTGRWLPSCPRVTSTAWTSSSQSRSSLHDLRLYGLLDAHLLHAPIFNLKFLHPSYRGRVHAAALAASLVDGGAAHPVLPARAGDQRADLPCFGISRICCSRNRDFFMWTSASRIMRKFYFSTPILLRGGITSPTSKPRPSATQLHDSLVQMLSSFSPLRTVSS